MTIVGNRITSPLTVANAAEDKRLEPIPPSPTGIALLPQLLVKIATVVVAVAVFVMTLPTMGIPLPPPVLAVCSAITGLGIVLGIGSQGIRKVEPASPPK